MCNLEGKDLNRLKVVLAEKKRTNKWLAEQIGVDQATVSKWCTNFTIYWRIFFNYYTYHFPTQNLLSDAEVTICKYKCLIISINAFILGYLK